MQNIPNKPAFDAAHLSNYYHENVVPTNFEIFDTSNNSNAIIYRFTRT